MKRPTLFSAFADRLSLGDRKALDLTSFSLDRVKIEVLSGLTVALALVPEAVAVCFCGRRAIRWSGSMPLSSWA